MLVKELRKLDTKDGKEYWTFHVVVEMFGQAVELTGWRYFTESQVVRPPQFNIHGKYVSMVHGLNQILEARIGEAVRRAMSSGFTSEAPAPPAGVVEEPKEFDVEWKTGPSGRAEWVKVPRRPNAV